LIEIINQILITIMLLAATVLIIAVTIILMRYGRRTEEERPRPLEINKVQPQVPQVESAPPTPPPTKPQETQTTEVSIPEPKPEDYSWMLRARRKEENTRASSSST